MNHFSKKICSLLCMFTLTLATMPAGAYDATSSNRTMNDIENDMILYLAEHHPDISYGTTEYVEYLTSILVENSDEILSHRSDYDDICTYAGEYLTYVDNMQVEASNEGEILSLDKEIGDKTVSQVKEEAAEQAKVDRQKSEEQSYTPIAYSSSYNRTAAVNYAKKWAKQRNSSFNTYTSDCTNFASQVLNAGGISMRKPSTIPSGTNSTTKYWYSRKRTVASQGGVYSKFDVSTSWINVSGFYSYTSNHGARIISCSSKNSLQNTARIGDIVQLQNSSGTWYHTIIITGGSKGNYTYCGHTTNRLNYPVSSIGNNNKFRIIRY